MRRHGRGSRGCEQLGQKSGSQPEPGWGAGKVSVAETEHDETLDGGGGPCFVIRHKGLGSLNGLKGGEKVVRNVLAPGRRIKGKHCCVLSW